MAAASLSLSFLRPSPSASRIKFSSSIKASAPVLTQDDLKKLAADKAVQYVKSGMVLGLGTGSTAAVVVDKLGTLLKSGALSDIVGVPTSKRTQEQAAALGIPLSTLDAHPTSTAPIAAPRHIDLTIDPNIDLTPASRVAAPRRLVLLVHPSILNLFPKFK